MTQHAGSTTVGSVPYSGPGQVSTTSFSIVPNELVRALNALAPFLFLDAPKLDALIADSQLTSSFSVASEPVGPSSDGVRRPVSASSWDSPWIARGFSFIPSAKIVRAHAASPI